jgi:hypothetical protein
MGKRALDMQLRKLEAAISRQEESLASLKTKAREREEQFEKTITTLRTRVAEVAEAAAEYKEVCDRERDREIKQYKETIKKLEKQVTSAPAVDEPPVESLKRAKTIAIFDSILFAIENWSTDGQIAPDIVMASQSILFPAVYERVMSGHEDYILEKVPIVALEIVKRGREFIKHIRTVCSSALSEEKAWNEYAPLVQEWWINDALPLIYGARDPEWETDECLKHIEIMTWREQPASRALDFPLIFDAMELVNRYPDQIRESTGLPTFTKQTVLARIEP